VNRDALALRGARAEADVEMHRPLRAIREREVAEGMSADEREFVV